MYNNETRIFFFWLCNIIIFLFVMEFFKDENNSVKNSSNSIVMEKKDMVSSSTLYNEKSINNIEKHPNNFVKIETNVFDVEISKLGGDIYDCVLKQYKDDKGKEIRLLFDNSVSGKKYKAISGFLGEMAPNTSSNKYVKYSSDVESIYDEELKISKQKVTLQWSNELGVVFQKIYTFYDNSYKIDVDFVVKNISRDTWRGHFFQSIEENDADIFHNVDNVLLNNAFKGGAYWGSGKSYNKVKFSDFGKSLSSEYGGWVALIERYFITSWIFSDNFLWKYYSEKNPNKTNSIGGYTDVIELEPNNEINISGVLYVGPEVVNNLEKLHKGLAYSVDYGVFWPISSLFMKSMTLINKFLDNWGFSIVSLVLLIKIIFWKLSRAKCISLAKMRKFAPELEKLTKKYGDDKIGLNKAKMSFYQKNKINPAAGCMPVFLLPFWIAMYCVLVESIEFRQAPFILWMKDLSMPDPYYILPLIVGAITYGTMLQTSKSMEENPVQEVSRKFLPVFMIAIMSQMPVGLVLYTVVTQTIDFIQQWLVFREEGALDAGLEK